jgi:HEPN domain-containing protein
MMEQTFDRGKTVNYWLECAAYDLETGKTLLEAGRFPYALFFGHLALEKALKALVVKESSEHAPFTHSLMILAKKANIELTEDMIDKLAEYTRFNIQARYPDEKKTFYDQCTKDFAYQKFSEMEELYKWLIKKSGN